MFKDVREWIGNVWESSKTQLFSGFDIAELSDCLAARNVQLPDGIKDLNLTIRMRKYTMVTGT